MRYLLYLLLLLFPAAAHAGCAVEYRDQWNRMPRNSQRLVVEMTALGFGLGYSLSAQEEGGKRGGLRALTKVFGTTGNPKIERKMLREIHEGVQNIYDANSHDCAHPSVLAAIVVARRLDSPAAEWMRDNTRDD